MQLSTVFTLSLILQLENSFNGEMNATVGVRNPWPLD